MTAPAAAQSRLGGRLIASVLFGVVALVGFGMYADMRELVVTVSGFDPLLAVAALALAAGNYAIRFVRWHFYLRRIGVDGVTRTRSLGIFLSGLSMSVTPGKLGELLKSLLLKTGYGVPVSRSAPIVFAERATDLIALLLLCAVGVASTRYGLEVVVGSTVVVVGGIALVLFRPVGERLVGATRHVPGLKRFTPRLLHAYESAVVLLSPWPLLVAVGLSVAAWWLECVAFHVVLVGFDGANPVLGTSTFIYAFATIAGAITMLPGGLIATEGSMIALLQSVFHVTSDKAVATAATLIVRFCTLWFAVLVGFVALALLRRAMRADLPLDEGQAVRE